MVTKQMKIDEIAVQSLDEFVQSITELRYSSAADPARIAENAVTRWISIFAPHFAGTGHARYTSDLARVVVGAPFASELYNYGWQELRAELDKLRGENIEIQTSRRAQLAADSR